MDRQPPVHEGALDVININRGHGRLPKEFGSEIAPLQRLTGSLGIMWQITPAGEREKLRIPNLAAWATMPDPNRLCKIPVETMPGEETLTFVAPAHSFLLAGLRSLISSLLKEP